MDYILNRIENRLSNADKGSFEYITYLRTRIEYSLFLCLGVLWKNFGKLPIDKQQKIIADLHNLSVGSAVSAIRDLNKVERIFTDRFVGQIDRYPNIRNAKFGHGYELAANIVLELNPLYQDMYDNSALFQEECDLIIIKRYDPDDDSYVGARFPSGKNGLSERWFCPKENLALDIVDFPRTYITYKDKDSNKDVYYKVSPFVFIDPSSNAEFVFNSLVEKLLGKVFLNGIFPANNEYFNQNYRFDELIYMSTQDENRQFSPNGTVMNNFETNYREYIDVGFHNQIEKFILKNRSYVSATIWGHGGVGKTACIQKICEDLFNGSRKRFSYIVFITAKDRVYNTRTGQINSGTGNISLYSEMIGSIACVILPEARSAPAGEALTDKTLAEYEKRICEFNDSLLIVIDDYETFEDGEKEKISNFLSRLNIEHHKVIITTRNRRFAIGEQYPCNELSRQDTKKFIQDAIQAQWPDFRDAMERVLRDEDSLAHIYEATSGRPIFIYQFIYLFMQKGLQENLIDDIRNSPNAQEFLYGKIYQYLGDEAKYLFAVISELTDINLRFRIDLLKYILYEVIEENTLEESLNDLVDQRVVELVTDTYGRVYSPEILKIMKAQYQQYSQDFRHKVEQRRDNMVENIQDGIGVNDIEGSIFEAKLKRIYHGQTVEYMEETVDEYRRFLNDPNVPHAYKLKAVRNLWKYLSVRLDKRRAIAAVEEYLPLFRDDAEFYIIYTNLLWARETKEDPVDLEGREKAIDVFRKFFSENGHQKTNPDYLTYFALGTGYLISFDINLRKYSRNSLRESRYDTDYSEYGKLLFDYVREYREVKNNPDLLHKIKAALYQTARLCSVMGRNREKIENGLAICDWLLQCTPGGDLRRDILDVRNSLNRVLQCMQYNVGDIVEVTVKRRANYGVFVYLDKSTTGLIYISEIPANRRPIDVRPEFTKGQRFQARIKEIKESDSGPRISLSLKGVAPIDQKLNMKPTRKT